MEGGLLSLKWNNHKTTFLENLKIQREKSNYTDVTLAVEGKFYYVHKFVMSTCSEYFFDIFERTSCKSPVIVLKDVQSRDIEALLDYMYLGEVNVNQNDLASLVKTAECLKIKGLAAQDEDPRKLCKNSNSNLNDTCQDSPPSKRRRNDSNTILPQVSSPVPSTQKSSTTLVNPAKTPFIPPPSTTITEEDEPPPVVKIEMDNDEEQEERFKRENDYEMEQNPENYGHASFSRPSIQQFNIASSNISNVGQGEPLDMKAQIIDAEGDERFRREYNYERGQSSDQDVFGDYGSDLSNTEHEPLTFGNPFFPGTSLQQNNNNWGQLNDLRIVTTPCLLAASIPMSKRRYSYALDKTGTLFTMKYAYGNIQ